MYYGKAKKTLRGIENMAFLDDSSDLVVISVISGVIPAAT
jgi:hypothetical protein